MKIQRRDFLKILGGTAAAAIIAPVVPKILTPSAPLFVPAQRLDFGVPTQRLIGAREAASSDVARLWQAQVARTQEMRDLRDHVPMILLQDNYISEYGGRLQAGSTLLVDQTTADRWIEHRIAVPATPGAAEAKRIVGREDRTTGAFSQKGSYQPRIQHPALAASPTADYRLTEHGVFERRV